MCCFQVWLLSLSVRWQQQSSCAILSTIVNRNNPLPTRLQRPSDTSDTVLLPSWDLSSFCHFLWQAPWYSSDIAFLFPAAFNTASNTELSSFCFMISLKPVEPLRRIVNLMDSKSVLSLAFWLLPAQGSLSYPSPSRQTCHGALTPQFCASWAPVSPSLSPHCHLYFSSGKQQDETPSAHQALWFRPMGCSQKAKVSRGETWGSATHSFLIPTIHRLASRRKHLQDMGGWCSPQ